MSRTTVGFVGAGNRARAHYDSLAAMDDVDLVAACDLDEDRLAEVVDEYDAEEGFADHETMLSEVGDALDAVYVVLPPRAFDPPVTDALERGLGVFAEKPPGVHPDQTRAWADLAARRGCTTCVGVQRRFHPLAVRAREAVEARGPVAYGRADFHKTHLDPAPNDLLFDVIHAIDLLAWMGDGIEDVHAFRQYAFAEQSSFDVQHANVFAGVVEFASGGAGVLGANRTAGGRSLTFELHGRAISAYGRMNRDSRRDELVLQRDGEAFAEADRLGVDDLYEVEEGDDLDPWTRADGTFQVSRHFVDCAAAGRETRASFAEAVGTMEAVEAVQAGTRLPTRFEDGEDGG